jgi:hypothetical protein
MHRRIPPDSNKQPYLLQKQQAETAMLNPSPVHRPLHKKDERYLVPARPVFQQQKLPLAFHPLAHKSYVQIVQEQRMAFLQKQRKASRALIKAKQHELDKLKQLVSNQRQKIEHLLEQLKQKKKGALKQTLFEKVVNSDECKKYLNNNTIGRSGCETKKSSYEYSQNVLLHKINTYLATVGKPPTRGKGHCHGITLLWLMMMYLDLQPLFYKLVQDISECPDYKLLTIHKKITTFLEWIDLGQNPGSYSNNTYQQRDVVHIIGGVTTVAAVRKSIFESDLADELWGVMQDNNMICFAGKGVHADTYEDCGHAIGVFVKKTPSGHFNYYVYDPNYKDNKHKMFNSPEMAAVECWSRAFAPMLQTKLRTIEMDVVRAPSVTHQSFVVPATPIMQSASALATPSAFQRMSLFGNRFSQQIKPADEVMKSHVPHAAVARNKF